MRNYCKTIGALAAATAIAAGNASAMEIDYNLRAGYTSEYIFRGTDLGDSLIEAGFGATTEISNVVLTLDAWYGSFDDPFSAKGDNDRASELDLLAKAGYDFGFATASVGYIWYHNFDNDNVDDAQEVLFSLSRDFAGYNVSLTYFWDVETDNDGYTELALGKSWEITDCVDITLGSALGYIVEEGQFAHWTNRLSVDWEFATNAKISPFTALSLELAEGEGVNYQDNETELVGGAMLSVTF